MQNESIEYKIGHAILCHRKLKLRTNDNSDVGTMVFHPYSFGIEIFHGHMVKGWIEKHPGNDDENYFAAIKINSIISADILEVTFEPAEEWGQVAKLMSN